MAIFSCLAVALGVLAPTPVAARAGPVEVVRAAIELACGAERPSELDLLADRVDGLELVEHRAVGFSFGSRARQLRRGIRHSFSLADGRLTVDWLAPERITVRYDLGEPGRPHLLAIADFGCAVQVARLVSYDAEGRADWLVHLDADLEPTDVREPLNPEVPRRRDPGGIPVALVDSGVNYLLPQIGTGLARDARGDLLGFDFWDMDARPFDLHPARSAFFPDRHGTAVASIVLGEAPVAKLLPYRYPRPDMRRMADLIEHAARHGVRIVNLSLVSHHRERWDPFFQAARRHPEILFVVAAGNAPRDLDRQPAYPAALPLDNLITVTAATGERRLVPGMSWGARTVDLMVLADRVSALDHDGRRRRVVGSSYATARVTALAACLLAAHPEWSVAALKGAIFALAEPDIPPGTVAQGFLPDPRQWSRGACAADRAARAG